MTTFRREDQPLRDATVAAAWRATSGEQPPAALDAAILAAARREIGAGPHRFAAQQASRASRRWWPLAAAASVAAIAAGLLQLVPPEQIGAPVARDTVVTDMPKPAAKSALESTAPAPAAVRKDVPMAGPKDVPPRESAGVPQRSPPSVAAPARKQAEPARQTAVLPEAFPGAPSKREEPSPSPRTAPMQQESFASAAPNRPSLAAAPNRLEERPSSVPAPPEPPAPVAPKGDAAATNEAPPSGMPAAPAAVRPPAPRASDNEPGRPTALGKVAAAPSAAGTAAEARAKVRAPLPVDEWIALIRRLRTEGNTEDAAKELAAFRAAHADHVRLLPADLREWHPPER